MKKLLKGLLLVALIAGSAKATTNKTALVPRSHGVNLAMEYTTWNELLQLKDDDRFGANFQATVFYEDSTEGDDIGKYFGIKGKNVFKLGTTALAVAPDSNTLDFIFHNAAGSANTTTIKLDPDHTAWGVRIDYYQDLQKILKGLYLKVALPIVNVDNDMHLGVSNPGGDLTNQNVYDYFKGNFAGITNPAIERNAQTALNNAMITGSHSDTGVADIDVVLGYKFLDKPKYHMSINLGLTIPVGDDAGGHNVFAPTIGNGEHWGFGAGLDFGAKLWEDGDQNIKITLAMNYRYLFESSEVRTLGLKNNAGTLMDWGQYWLVAKPSATAVTATPAANILTRSCDVTPGSQFDGILALAYNNGGFTLDLGYNLFWKEHDDVDLKNWTDEVTSYGLLHGRTRLDQNMLQTDVNWSTGDPTVVAVRYDTGNPIKLIKANISTAAAETPSYCTNKIYGGLGYIFKEWKYPLMLGLAADYEFGDDESIEKWGIWGKIGVAF